LSFANNGNESGIMLSQLQMHVQKWSFRLYAVWSYCK